jgi:ubiquitin C-terminal hydrolase
MITRYFEKNMQQLKFLFLFLLDLHTELESNGVDIQVASGNDARRNQNF